MRRQRKVRRLTVIPVAIRRLIVVFLFTVGALVGLASQANAGKMCMNIDILDSLPTLRLCTPSY